MDSGGRLSFRYTTILLPICIFTFLITLDGYEMKRSISQNDDSFFGNRKEKFLGKNFFLVRGKNCSKIQFFNGVALPLSMGFPDFFFFLKRILEALQKNALRLKLKSIWASKNLEIAL